MWHLYDLNTVWLLYTDYYIKIEKTTSTQPHMFLYSVWMKYKPIAQCNGSHTGIPRAVSDLSHVKLCTHTWGETLFPSLCSLTADHCWRSEQVNDFTLHTPHTLPIQSANVVMWIELRCPADKRIDGTNPIWHNVATHDAIDECVWFIWLMSYFSAQVAFFSVQRSVHSAAA